MIFNSYNQDRVQRIETMEEYLDEIKTKFNEYKNNPNHSPLFVDQSFLEKLNKLAEYYFEGVWREDYEAEERGELPKDLKRGVLAQDTIYNLYMDIQELMNH